MRSEKKTVTSIVLVLLIYAFMVGNTSGDLVLCIGAKGQVSLKSANHEHSHNHSHIELNEPPATEHQHDAHLQSPHLKTCIDIPIFIGSTDNRLPLKPVKPNQDMSFCLLPTEVITYDSFIPPTVPRGDFSLMDENRFLRCIILIV